MTCQANITHSGLQLPPNAITFTLCPASFPIFVQKEFKNMVTAFVLINVCDRMVHETVKALQKCRAITEVHIVAGDYDMVAVVRVDKNQELASTITNCIVQAPGVERTKTLFALESFSSFDLKEIYSAN